MGWSILGKIQEKGGAVWQWYINITWSGDWSKSTNCLLPVYSEITAELTVVSS